MLLEELAVQVVSRDFSVASREAARLEELVEPEPEPEPEPEILVNSSVV